MSINVYLVVNVNATNKRYELITNAFMGAKVVRKA